MAELTTIRRRQDDGVAWVTLDRPDRLNAFDGVMLAELRATWRELRADDRVRAIVLDAAGDRAFCTGVDRDWALAVEEPAEGADAGAGPAPPGAVSVGEVGTPFQFDDPGAWLGPKANDLWKPVVAAVQGMACGGAFYLLGEVDVIVASDDATFFDPHVTYGMAAVFESVHLLQRLPLGEVLRMQLLGAHERVSAARAHQLGFVSEVVPPGDLAAAAAWVARTIASQPALAVQATLRTIWTANELSRAAALDVGVPLVAAGNAPEALAEGQRSFASGQRVTPRVR
ncbi:enoyl-CoA hydratase/isomerase family protein [Nitriliruptor alkaliphilus]|uniref:enoyl-CoA hydratase/isomerase family protein n=1 Tax=Nitriliruptor alkaliphilus TaxID=427918 RepID=UPI000696263E|nr:enoyl-CoA hydratase/isomerase family protein [Nitriliruptor alkaliphilus]